MICTQYFLFIVSIWFLSRFTAKTCILTSINHLINATRLNSGVVKDTSKPSAFKGSLRGPKTRSCRKCVSRPFWWLERTTTSRTNALICGLESKKKEECEFVVKFLGRKEEQESKWRC